MSEVICNLCYAAHKPEFGDISLAHNQGVDCAASVFQLTHDTFDLPAGTWVLQGHYGSDFDTTWFVWKGATPVGGINPVCDSCIRELIEEERLMFVVDGII